MGYMKDYDRRIRQGGDDAIAALGEYVAMVEPRWIPVEERLPQPGERVIVSGGLLMDTAWYENGRFIQFGEEYRPTHWMPLPEPPTQ